MSFKKQQITNHLLYDTPVENLFISEYARTAPGDFVKVYLIGLMYANAGKPIENSKIAKMAGLSPEIVEESWNYWKEQGIVDICPKGEGSEPEIEFLSIRETVFGKASVAPKKDSGIARVLEDKESAKLFRDIESVCGRLLEAKEPEVLASWVKDYGISPDVILMAYSYCVQNNRSTRCRYVEKIVMDWNGRGLKNAEDVKDYLEENDRRYSYYRSVFRMLGFRRNPTQAEKDIMDSWVNEYDFSLSDIEQACKKTSGINNPNINYVNTVLLSSLNDTPKEDGGNYPDLEDIYEKLREENKKKTEFKREKIYKAVPGLKETVDEIRDCGIRISQSMLMGGRDDLEKERELQKRLLLKKKELLTAKGLTEDVLDPIYSCTICSDTGLTEDGRRCSCYLERIKDHK